jgi:hypothetical protein
VFRDAGLSVVSTTQYDQEQHIEPPYDDAAMRAAQRKATGTGLAHDRETILNGEATPAEYDALRERWRSMGRDVIEQMQDDSYKRRETVPFFVTVGGVP